MLTWLVMLAAQVALFALHPYLVARRDEPPNHRFYGRHRIYLLVTTAQWLGAATHGAFALVTWRAEARARAD